MFAINCSSSIMQWNNTPLKKRGSLIDVFFIHPVVLIWAQAWPVGIKLEHIFPPLKLCYSALLLSIASTHSPLLLTAFLHNQPPKCTLTTEASDPLPDCQVPLPYVPSSLTKLMSLPTWKKQWTAKHHWMPKVQPDNFSTNTFFFPLCEHLSPLSQKIAKMLPGNRIFWDLVLYVPAHWLVMCYKLI